MEGEEELEEKSKNTETSKASPKPDEENLKGENR